MAALGFASASFTSAGCTGPRPSIEEGQALVPSNPITTPVSASIDVPGVGAGVSLSTTTTARFEPTNYEIIVVSIGAEPRFDMTIKPTLNASSQLIFVDEKEVALSVGEDQNEPPIATRASTELDTIVSSINNEEFTIRTTIGPTRIDQTIGPRWALNALAQTMTSMEGNWIDLTSNSQLAERGQQVQQGLDRLTTVETLAGFADSLSLAQIPVPTEELGPGAIWTTSIQTLAGGLPATITSRATILEISDESVTAEVHIEVEYQLGNVQLSNGPASLLAGTIQLDGHLTWLAELPFALYELQSSSTLTARLDDPVEGVSQFTQDIERTYSLQLR